MPDERRPRIPDDEANRLYHTACQLEELSLKRPAIRGRRRAGTRHALWQFESTVGAVMVRLPLRDQPPLIPGTTMYPETDVLKWFDGSGVTARLLHDGGDQHIQEYLPGHSMARDSPMWDRWVSRAPADVPRVLARLARVMPPGAAPSLAHAWEAEQDATRGGWAGAWQRRERLYSALGVPRDEFDSLLRQPLTGNRPPVGVHRDTKIENWVLTPNGAMIVDLERFGSGDCAADLALHLLSARYDEDLNQRLTDDAHRTFREEVSPATAEGLHEDVPRLMRFYGAVQVMGTLDQRVGRLEALAAGRNGRAAAEEALSGVTEDIRANTNFILEKFGRPPWGEERMASALGQWILQDHPDAPGHKTTPSRHPHPGVAPVGDASAATRAALVGLGPAAEITGTTPERPTHAPTYSPPPGPGRHTGLELDRRGL